VNRQCDTAKVRRLLISYFSPSPMVLSVLIATISAPGLLGSQEAIRQSQSKDKREEHRARRCNLIAACVKSSKSSREIDGRPVVLKHGRLWIDTGTEDGSPLGHPYAGYYLPYPDTKYEGLVTTITDEAPIMNWVYIDRETHQVKYGVRDDAQPNLTGPFDCTRQDRRLTFDGWEGWCAVEETPGSWALYFDVEDNGLTSKVAPGIKVLELELSRKEKRFQREKEARQQDQTTKRSVNTEMDAPVDQPISAEVLVSRPGVVDAPAEEGSGKPEVYKPLKIPKSIFEDPPPIVAPLVFRPRTPKTPPPAYSPAAREESFSIQGVRKDDQSGQEPEVDDAVSTAPNQPLQNARPTTSKLPVPFHKPSTTGPVPEKHVVLRRSSGTKALAQAHMFEALAAGRERKTDEWGKDPLRSPVDRIAMEYASQDYSTGRRAFNKNSTSKPEAQGNVVPPDLPSLAATKGQSEEQDVEKSVDGPSQLRSEEQQAMAAASKPPLWMVNRATEEGPDLRRPLDKNVRSNTSAQFYATTKVRNAAEDENAEAVSSPNIASTIKEPALSSKIPGTMGRPGHARPLNSPRQPLSIARSTQQIPSRIPPPRQDSHLQRKRSSSEMLQSSTSSPSRSPSKAAATRAIREPARASLARAMTTDTRNQGMANRLAERRDEARPSRGRSSTMQSSGACSRGVLERRPASALLRDIDELATLDGGNMRRATTDDEGKSKWT